MSRELIYLTWIDVKNYLEEGVDTIILPVGCIEAHGPHLPLATDVLIPLSIAQFLAPKINALIAPPIFYGVVRSLSPYPGSISISPQTLKETIKSVLFSLRQSGFKYFIIINGHGSRDHLSALKEACRESWLENKCVTILINWWEVAEKIAEELFSSKPGHAGVDETSMILTINEKLVKKRELESEIITPKPGIEIFPSPGSIISDVEKYSIPSMEDVEKFKLKVLNEILTYVSLVLSKYREKHFI